MKILELLAPDAIKVPLDADDKMGAIGELVDVLAQVNDIEDPETLKSVVWERESQRSTGIGEGLAIPHGKSDCVQRLVIALGRPATPMDFASVDKKPVELIVLLVSPPSKTTEHIQALSKISRLMVNPEFRASAYAASTATELYELFSQAGM